MGKAISNEQWRSYCEEIFQLRIYPPDRPSYLGFGVYSEVGEIMGKYKKSIRDGTPVDSLDALHELGDICWYIANISIDINLQSVPVRIGNSQPILMNRMTTDFYQNLGLMADLCVGVARAHGLMVEDGAKKSSALAYRIPLALAAVDFVANRIALALDPAEDYAAPLHLSMLLHMNLIKLKSRRDRGTLPGSGDNR